MKSFLFILIIGLFSCSVSAQEITVAYLTEQKSKAEWLQEGYEVDSLSIPFTEADFQVVNEVADKLITGRAMTISGFLLSPFYVGPLFTTFQGAFTRMPAHRQLSKFIRRKYNYVAFDKVGYKDLNLQHLMKAERYLKTGQKVSYISIGLILLNVIVSSQIAENYEGNDKNKIVAYGVATIGLTNVTASGINLVLMNKALRELRKIH
jgi:hypothetical protein